jgi:hypothetical protein
MLVLSDGPSGSGKKGRVKIIQFYGVEIVIAESFNLKLRRLKHYYEQESG